VGVVTRSLVDGLAGVIGVVDPDRRGTSVHAHEDRRGTGLVTHYPLGVRSALWSDPDVAESVTAAIARHADEPLTRAGWDSIARSQGAVPVGVGLEHLLPDRWVAPSAAATVVDFDPELPDTVRRVTDLLARCPEDDRDEADFDPQHLDPFLVGWVDGDELVALAGGRPEPVRPGFHDIGVLVRPDRRREGIGVALVAAVSARLLDAGEYPLYRCNLDNVGSRRLAEQVGYVRALEIAAYRWLRPT
jgi:GNAT superfamily N-acetyltransferase